MVSGKRRLLAHQLFELQVRRSKGAAFQDLFNAVMNRAHKDFVPMRPYGNLGDRKNDGYIRGQGLFFQVYSPSGRPNLAKAIAKVKTDFHGLLAYWKPTHSIGGFCFAFNDEYAGSIVPIQVALDDLENTSGIPCSVYLAKDLEQEALSLPLEQLEDVLNTLVPEVDELPDADYAAVRDVVQFIMESQLPPASDGALLAPDFSKKIAFNGLSEHVGSLLLVAARQSEVLVDFFSHRAGTHLQDLRNHLASVYEDAKRDGAADGETADAIFFRILERITPPQANRSRTIQNAALIVMAYYFEACDIFESSDAVA